MFCTQCLIDHMRVEKCETLEVFCPQCHGPVTEIGRLGSFLWFRCRDCGWTFDSDGNGE